MRLKDYFKLVAFRKQCNKTVSLQGFQIRSNINTTPQKWSNRNSFITRSKAFMKGEVNFLETAIFDFYRYSVIVDISIMCQPKSGMQFIYIILIVFDCSVSTDHVQIVRIWRENSTFNDEIMTKLFPIYVNEKKIIMKTGNSLAFSHADNSLDFSESNQRNTRSLMPLSEEDNHWYENSETLLYILC